MTPVTRGDVTVLVGPGQDAPRWLDLAARAAADAHDHLPPVAARGAGTGAWSSRSPAAPPTSPGSSGAAPSAYATTAAVTRPEGPTTAAAVRVVVNPATAQDPDAELATR